MKSLSHFLSVPILAILPLLIIPGISVSPIYATTFRGRSDAERFVLEQLQKGEVADLAILPETKRELSSVFLENLLTNPDIGSSIRGQQLVILHALINEPLILNNKAIDYDVFLAACSFNDRLLFTNTKFAKGLTISDSTFSEGLDISGSTFDNLNISANNFSFGASFSALQVSRDFIVRGCTFHGLDTSFTGTHAGERFEIDESTFFSKYVSFESLRVGRDFSARNCVFKFQPGGSNVVLSQNGRGDPTAEILVEGGEGAHQSLVTFAGSHFTDFFLDGSQFEGISVVDFTRMETDYLSLDRVSFATPSKIKLQRLAFKLVSPVNADQLRFLLADYSAQFYADLETSFRMHGYPDEADKVFIAKKRAERRENCKDFLRQCNRGAWTLSVFEDLLAGYGKSLQNLLYWSMGFLLLGTVVFCNEKGMRTRDGKDAAQYQGKYNAFWYSLDLFLPIIKLGEADVWTPKDNRRWANFYRKLHIIIGSLFVPIGLAAWTGIIK